MRFDIITLFPSAIAPYFEESMFRRARDKKLVRVELHDLRQYGQGPHRKVDDRPFGGGPGMVLMLEPIYRAVQNARRKARRAKRRRVILFSTRGKKLDAGTARRLTKYDQLILICGRYEGVDERVAERIADEEISIGDFILSGGELPALILAEAVSRFLPGFLGKAESLEEHKGSYAVFTRPAEFTLGPRENAKRSGGSGQSARRGGQRPKKSWRVPQVLLRGDHAEIKKWRDGI